MHTFSTGIIPVSQAMTNTFVAFKSRVFFLRIKVSEIVESVLWTDQICRRNGWKRCLDGYLIVHLCVTKNNKNWV